MLLRGSEVVALAVAASVVAADLAVGAASPAVLLLLLATTFSAAVVGARWWAVLAGDAVAFAVVDPHALSVSDLTFSGGLVVVAYVAGRALWAGRHRVSALERTAMQAAARREELLAAAVTAERAAIAVELHDIVTHAVSAIVVQAQAGRRGTSDVAAEALAVIENTSRSAMTELRRLLTLLSTARPAAVPTRSWSWLPNVALMLGVGALGELELWSAERYDGHLVWPGPRWCSALLIVALAASLLLRRNHPEGMAAAVFGLLMFEELSVGATEAVTGLILLVVATFSAAAHDARWRVLVPLVLLQCSLFAVTDSFAEGLFDRLWVFGLAAIALAAGAIARLRHRRLVGLEQNAAATAAESDRQVEQALAADRRNLALELHDIVSHAVAVIVIQAQAGGRVPESASDALSAIEESARTAMTELRRLLVLLLPGGGHADVRPTPSLLELDELLLRWRSSGLHVDLHADDLPPLPPAVDLAAYRIVQESLTNTARHAPGARVRVDLTLVGDQLEISTRDYGDGSTASTQGAGRGLVGMRQRAELVGGELLAAERAEDGFVIRARLPVAGVSA